MKQALELTGFWDKWNEIKDEIAQKGKEAGKGAELLKAIDTMKKVGVVVGIGIGVYVFYRIASGR